MTTKDKAAEPAWMTYALWPLRKLGLAIRNAEEWANTHSASIGFVVSTLLVSGIAFGIVYGALMSVEHGGLKWGLIMTGLDLAGFAVLFLLIPIQGWAARGGGRQ